MCDMFPQIEETISEEIPPELISLGNGIRSMKWHIFNADKSSEAYGCSLCWDEPAIEFDSREVAERFALSVMESELECGAAPDIINGMFEIKECIYYYDGGYINLSNYIVKRNGDTDELREVGPIGSEIVQ